MKLFLYCILTAWFIIAVGRTIYNFSKIYTEDRQLVSITDDEKRLKIFGDLYTFIRFIDKNTNNKSSILSIYDDNRTYYYGRYSLFPKTFVNYSSPQEIQNKLKNNRYNYFVTSLSNVAVVNSLIVYRYTLQKKISVHGKIFTLYKKI